MGAGVPALPRGGARGSCPFSTDGGYFFHYSVGVVIFSSIFGMGAVPLIVVGRGLKYISGVVESKFARVPKANVRGCREFMRRDVES